MLDQSSPKGRILAAALACAAAKSWSDVTLLDIAEAAGLGLADLRQEKAGSKTAILAALLRAGGSNLLAPEQRFLSDLGNWCRRAVHLQCSGGLDTLSLWRQGAQEVIGIDISERMVASAQRKSIALGAPATWYCCDVLEIPHALDETADLVYTGRGALCWMMDIEAWSRVQRRVCTKSSTPAGSKMLSWFWSISSSA